MKRFYFTILLSTLLISSKLISSNAQSLSNNYSQSNLNEYALHLDGFSAGSSTVSASMNTVMKKAVFPKSRGFVCVANVGGTYIFAGREEGENVQEGEEVSTSLVGVDFIAGYRLSNFTSVAVGVGYYTTSDNLHSNVPVFFELRNHYTQNRLSPFTTVNLGYAIRSGRTSVPSKPQSGIIEGGPLVGVNVGIRYLFTNSTGVNLFAGYVGHKSTIERHYLGISENGPSSIKEPNWLHQIKFGIGVTF